MKLICFQNKVATVELNGVQKDLPAHNSVRYDGTESIIAYGVAVRYPTGKKIWSASASFNSETGRLNGVTGPLDHRSRFENLTVLGFYDDFAVETHSRHNGN